MTDARAGRMVAASTASRDAVLLSIVIPTLNGMAYLPKCLESVARERAEIPGITEVIVVDNGSTDDTVTFCRSEHPDIRVLALRANEGFAGASDRGVEAARGEFCFLLNNDAWIEPGSVAKLLRRAACGGHSIVGLAVLDPSGALQCGAATIDLLGEPTQAEPGRPPFFVAGTALLFRRRVYQTLGGFDRRYFAQFEEVDLQWRAHLWGMGIAYEPDACVYHVGGGTMGGGARANGSRAAVTSRQRLYLGRRNQLAMMLVNYSARSLLWILPIFCFSVAVQCLGAILTRHPVLVAIYGQAFVWNARHLPGTLRRRRRVQAGRSVPDREIRRYFAPPFVRLRMMIDVARRGTHVDVR